MKIKKIPINTDTKELYKELKGHSLDRRVEESELLIYLTKVNSENLNRLLNLFREYKDTGAGAEIWKYRSTMPLAGTSGFAVIIGEYVIGYYPTAMH